MPLSDIQKDVLAVIARNRNPESYIAGGAALNYHWFRLSDDIDIFNDNDERVEQAAHEDEKALVSAGFGFEIVRKIPGLVTAKITKSGQVTKLEWVHDSDFRFYPVQPDKVFGYVLHPIDLATNKAAAAAGRCAARDFIDLLYIHQHILPVGALAWATVGKAVGFSPEGLIEEQRRNISRLNKTDFEDLKSEMDITPEEVVKSLRQAFVEAEEFLQKMPPGSEGSIFFEKDGRIVQPDPARLGEYTRHAGKRRGHWPSSQEIASEMFKTYMPRRGQ